MEICQMDEVRWQKQISGDNCPFCVPRVDENEHWSKVQTLNVSTLYLHKIQGYKGYCLLVFDPRHAVRPSELSSVEWSYFCTDLWRSQHAVERVLEPDHMNVAALGNQMAHMHWHIIPRYVDDPRWGAPIWTNTEEEMAIGTLPLHEFQSLIVKIREELV